MFRTLFSAILFAVCSTLPAQAGTAQTAPAYGDSGLGIIGGNLTLGFSDHILEGGFTQGTVDVAITAYHGMQIDLQYEERSLGGIGRLGTFLYMTPRADHKYGISLMVADKNGAPATYGQVGAMGMFTLGTEVNLEARGAIGMSSSNKMDWITAGLGLHWQVTPSTNAYAQYDLTDFSELEFNALAHEVTFGLRTRINDSPAALFAEVSHDWLSGAQAAEGNTTLRAGVSVFLGRTGNNQPTFRVSDPMRQILRRGLF